MRGRGNKILHLFKRMENEVISEEVEILCDDGKGHKTFVKNDHPECTLLKCYQHVGRE